MRLADTEATEAQGRALAVAVREVGPETLSIYLHGDLGAGKTTLTRGFMRGFDYADRVPSPTYTLVEPYECGGYRIFHLDLYRLGDGAELEFLGYADMLEPRSIVLVEWPEKAQDYLPAGDVEVALSVAGEGRELGFAALSAAGEQVLSAMDH